jgi:sugar O-acyltransferase (sialic acid O-acetyltransferase NeuD family)
VVFGGGKIAEVVMDELKERGYRIDAICVDSEYLDAVTVPGTSLVSLDDVTRIVPPVTHDAFIAVGYQNLNDFRKGKVSEFSSLGYQVVGLPTAENGRSKNTMVARGSIVQSRATIGSNSFVWSGAVVGHHSTVGEDCWVSSGAIIAGNCKIGDSCFIGVGAVITNEVTIGARSIIGAGALVTRDVPPGSVLFPKPATPSGMNSDDFNRLFPV